MASPYFRRRVLSLSGAALIAGTAGCLGGAGPTLDGTEPRTERTTTRVAGPSDDEAEDRALRAEREYVTERLRNASCVEGWGLTDYAGIERSATVANRTADGVTVEVTHPYWYGTTNADVDDGTSATYLVTADEVRRVGGDDLSPC